jgi:nitrate/nitrite transporter NarK
MLAYGLLMRAPESIETQRGGHPSKVEVSSTGDLRQTLANLDIWLLGLEFACFNLALISLSTFYPTFLTEVRGYSLASAGRIASISTVVILFCAPLAGWLSDRIHSRRLVFSLPFLAITALLLLPFRVTGWQIYASMAVLGLAGWGNPFSHICGRAR